MLHARGDRAGVQLCSLRSSLPRLPTEEPYSLNMLLVPCILSCMGCSCSCGDRSVTRQARSGHVSSWPAKARCQCLQVSQSAAGDNAAQDVSALVKTLGTGSAEQPMFAKDDRVIVIQGDMRNLTGTVERLGDDGLLYVKGDIAEMRNQPAVPLKAAQLSKYFAVRLSCPHPVSCLSCCAVLRTAKLGTIQHWCSRWL